MRGVGEFEFAQHLDLRLAAVGIAELIVGLRRTRLGDPFSLEGLELDSVGSCFLRRNDQPPCEVERTIMIHASLSDNVGAA